jgi:predicted glycoside hydrolase/deacetylase ChbG (UPF0249 family)
MNNQCRLIVNADDLGWAAGRDRGIFRSAEHGIVTSVSLMANGATFAAAVTELHQHDLGIGVHLNLADGQALSGSIRGLTDEQGWFLGKQHSRESFVAGCFDYQQVWSELHLQVQRVLDCGLPIDHIDSHQHLFLFPLLTPLLVKLCQHFNIGATRLPVPVETLPTDLQPQLWDELCLYRHYSGSFKRRLAATTLFTPDGLLGMPLLNRLDETTLLPTLRQLQPGCWELMVHPGDQDYGMDFCGIERQREQYALTSTAVTQTLKDAGVLLTTFGACTCGS